MRFHVGQFTQPRALSGPLVGLSFASGAAIGLRLARSPYPRPGASVDQVRTYFQGSVLAARISVAGQLVSSAALVPFTMTVADLAARDTTQGRLLASLAVVAGGAAAASLATSALCSAALTGTAGQQDDMAATLHRRSFLAGGPIHTAAFGLLTGVLGVAGLRTGALPRPLSYAACASATAGMLSLLALVAAPAAWFIPAGRFSGLLISGIAGARLARQPR